ncbi:MAG: amidohydrolase [Synergistaceae bacterium]|jgi:aminobenzoyl-glutamate utilization protein B|nr:amidohydrolase [Synergistaceae bacterium]
MNAAVDKKALATWIDKNKKPFEDLALEIWEKPEMAHEEKEAVRLQTAFLEKRGFRVTQKEGLPTAFMAEWGTGGPVVGILGEYDALAGLSQAVTAKCAPVVPDAPGHGCGHNLLGVGCMLAACAVKEIFAAQNIAGTVRYYGCPAEEQLTGKGEMAKLGYFQGTDLSLAWHPGDHTSVSDSVMTALVSAKFKFKGKAAHAGGSPEAGRSALDAVELMNVGANYVREHMIDQDRLHYVITNGGLAPNIVPSDAEVWYYARAPHDGELRSLWNRLVNVAQGAAMMTETQVSHHILGGCYNTLANRRLNKALEENLISFAGSAGFDAEDLKFGREIQATLPKDQIEASLAKLSLEGDDRILDSTPLPCFDTGTFIMGSTDVGDVANMMPTSLLWGATWPVGVVAHSWQATACTGSAIGLKGMIQASKALAGCIYDIAKDASIVSEAKEEFAQRREGRKYCPIEDLLQA